MPAIGAVTLEGIKVTELALGSVLGMALGVAAALAPRLRPLLPVVGAAIGVLFLAGFHVADGWVVAAVVITAGTSGASALLARSGRLASSAPTMVVATGALIGSVLLAPAVAAMVEVPRPPVVVGFAALAALASLASDRHLSGPAVVAMGAWTAFGLFLCNPDTEGSSLVGSLLAASAVVTTLLAAIRRSPSAQGEDGRIHETPPALGRAVPLVLLLVWIGVNGASGREDTIIGGYACLGVLLVLPLAVGLSLLVPGRELPPIIISGRLLTAVQAPLVVVCARIGGIRTTAGRAVLVSSACLALATAVLALALAHQPRAPEPSSAADI